MNIFSQNQDGPLPNGPRRFRLLISICAMFVAGVGFVSLLGWVLELPVLESLGSGMIPVAPSTAVMFVLYACAIYLRTHFQKNRVSYWAGVSINTAGALLVALLLVLSLLGIQAEAEHLGFSVINKPGEVHIGHMSPVTAFCFLLSSLSSLLSLPFSRARRWAANIAWWLACGIIATGSTLVLAYLYGTPLLYGSNFIPPAAPTSLAFIALGTALLALAAPHAWPSSARNIESSTHTSYTFLLVFVLLAAGIVIAGFLYFRNYELRHRTEVEHQLSAIADLKVDELVHWQKERLGDAALFYKNLNFSGLVQRYLQRPEDEETARKLRTWLQHVRDGYQYDRVFLLDAAGRVRMSAPDARRPISSHLILRSVEVLRTKQVVFEDFYRNEYDGRTYLAVLIPILDERGNGRAVGTLALRMDPEEYFYPFITRWPAPSITAETLLVRREGNEALFLNELRFQKNTALNMHISLDQKDSPAAQAVLGRQGIMEGRDYRGVPVIADMRPVPDTPWFLVSRMDISEVYEPMREKLWMMVALVGALLMGAGGGVGLVWRRQRTKFFHERYKASEALRESETRLRTLVQTIPELVWLKDVNGVYLACNPMFERLYGARDADIVGKTDYDFVSKELADFFREHDRKAMAAGKPSSNEEWLTFADDGHRALMDTIKTPMYDAGGNPVGVLGIARDITERKQAEEELATSEAKFRRLYQEFHGLLDAVPDILMLLDKDMKVVWANRVAADFIGVTPEAITGHYCHSLWYKRATPCDPCPVMKSFSTGRPQSETITRPDGRIWDIRTVPLTDEGGSIARVIEVVREVTEHSRLEAQYLQAQKMESIGTLAGGVAHDFNNILSAIIGYGHVTLMKMADGDPLRSNIEHILEAADRAARLTKELLLFSRKHVSERKPVELNEVVSMVEKFLRMVIGEDIACKTMLQERSLPVYADSHQFEQVLMNLATNARDAMPRGGAFTVKTEQIDLTEDFTSAHGYGKSGTYAMLTISDTGIGMDEATRKRIFEPFYTTKEVGKGTGLGLAVVYGIIKQHDGFINVYSEPGKGTTFRIYLPIIGALVTEETKAQRKEAPARGTETVLVAEDDENLRKLSRTVLADFGYTVIEAVDGEEAVKKFMENKDTIQLLLFDLIMPKMNGKEASDEIRKIKPDMKVLFASGYDPDLLQQKALLEDGVHLVYKPISPMDLLRKVRSVLDGVTH
jgi:two-component system, cell cycle sensor histidine kinase and response regulator CckA